MINARTNGKLKVCRFVIVASVSVIILGLVFNAIGNNIKGAHAANPAAVVDTLTVSIESTCSLTHSGGGTYTKSINPGSTGTVTANTITATCNDAGGYTIYAIGYSGDSFEGNNTDLISSSNTDWNIKTDGSFADSYWKVQFTASGQATITSPYTTYQQIPASYAKVASYNEYTTGGSIIPHYQISLGQGQPAGTYEGKVQYVLVNPSGADGSASSLLVMQNMTSSDCTSTAKRVIDIRDSHIYTVQRLKDGKCWMMENLDLGRTSISTDLTSTNTNLATTVTAATFNSWKKTKATDNYDSGEFISLTSSNTRDGLAYDAISGTPYGTLYNFYAATAGTVSGEDSRSDAQYDICPAGWRLPTGGDSGEFQALYNQYNSSALMMAPIAENGAAFALSGEFDGSGFGVSGDGFPICQGLYGVYWSSTHLGQDAKWSAATYDMIVDPWGTDAASYYDNALGLSVRCVMK